MPNKTPHVHAALIKAWADGAQIEYRYLGALNASFHNWRDLDTYTLTPTWNVNFEYRIKPEPHKWQKEMDAYAAGKVIQWRDPRSKYPGLREWNDAKPGGGMGWYDTHEYRIAPEQKVYYTQVAVKSVHNSPYIRASSSGSIPEGASGFNLKLTFEESSGTMTLVAAEVLKTDGK